MKLHKKIVLLLLFIVFHLAFWIEYAKTDIVTIYPTADNGIDSDDPTTINRSQTSYAIGHTNSTVYRYIAQFDLLSIIPPGSSINSATFYMYENTVGSSGLTLRCYQLTENWTSGYACWNNRDNATAWTTAGGTFNPTELGNYTYQDTNGAEASYTATSTIQDWWNTPANNDGLLVKNDAESGQPFNNCGFYTVDTGYNNYRPKLVIDYTATGQTQVTIAKHSGVNSLCKGTSNLVVGTFKYYADNTSEARDLSTITITEYGTCDADAVLSNIKLFTDTDGIYNGTESQLATSTSFNASNQASFDFSSTPVTAEYATTNYIHVILDVSPSAVEDTTVGIEITSSGDVTISSASDDISTYAVQLGAAIIKSFTFYYVNSTAPDNSGVPDGNPDVLDNCWQTIGQAFSDLCTNESNDLTGKGKFYIQIQNSADYVEGVALSGLTTTSSDTLTIRSKTGERPTWKNDTSTVLFANYDSQNSYGALLISISYVTIQGINFTGTLSHGVGAAASFTTIRNCIFHDLIRVSTNGNFNHNSAGIWRLGQNSQAYNNTFYNVISAIFQPDFSGATVRNNIFCVNDCSTLIEQVFLSDGGFYNNAPDSDYNIFYVDAGNRLAYTWSWVNPSETYTTLVDWQACYLSPDANSISEDPKFVTPGSDFHLKSTAGHWTSGGWINDAESSPCIDAGTPYSGSVEYTYYDNETEDNGDMVNMGAYANTDQASRSGAGTNISISIDSSACDFGTVLKNSTNVSISSITVTNDGDVNERYCLHLASHPGWTCVTDTAPGAEEFRMCGNFQTATAQTSHFDIGGSFSDAIGTTQRVCSTGDFAKDDEGEAAKGYNVPPSEDRYLWFRFESPSSTTLKTQQTITVTITAEEQP